MKTWTANYYIERARNGEVDEAFHGLRELGADALPSLQTAYRCENDPIVRSLIVEAVWQQRRSSAIAFLAEALQDPTPVVWKQALDGLVTNSSVESISALRAAASKAVEPERRAWIEEAIEQATNAIDSER